MKLCAIAAMCLGAVVALAGLADGKGGDGSKGMRITLKRIEIRPLKPDEKPTEPTPAKHKE